MKLEQKRQLAFSVAMALVMTGVMSAVLTGVNIKPEQHFLSTWLQSFAIEFLVALPLVHFLAPVLRALVIRIIR